MAVAARIDPIDRDIALIVNEGLSPAARSAAIAAAARDALAEAQEANRRALGYVPPHRTFVDGRAGAPLASVDPERGRIVFDFELYAAMLQWIHDALRRHSPVGPTGRYGESHRLYVDGTEIAPGQIAGIEDGRELVFLSTVPYARKIEGMGNRPPSSPQAPEGVYEVVARLAHRRWGRFARITFDARAPVGGTTALEAWARQTRQRRRRGGSARAISHWLRRQPAIVITPR